MARKFSFGPSLSIKGRKWKGLRGWAGKPFHPPLTDVPITAYLLGAVFDVLSLLLHSDRPEVSHQLYVAGGWCFLAGALVSLPTALTGWADWHRSSKVGTQARRTINSHAILMIATSVIVLVDIALRYNKYDDHGWAPGCIVALSVLAALVVSTGATYGGALVYEYGFNVETSGDHPVWHESEEDVYPGDDKH